MEAKRFFLWRQILSIFNFFSQNHGTRDTNQMNLFKYRQTVGMSKASYDVDHYICGEYTIILARLLIYKGFFFRNMELVFDNKLQKLKSIC